MIPLREHEDVIMLPIKARPGARRNAITGEHNGRLKVSVTQAPEKGKANKVLATLLAKSLGLRKSQVELLSGETSSEKNFLLRDIPAAELQQRLESLLQEIA